MKIRTYQPGDEAAQVAIYNEAAGAFPKFKPVTLDDLRRRFRDPSADAGCRFYAYDGDLPLGYASFQLNGRVSYPWCLAEGKAAAEPLFAAALDGLRARGVKRAFAAYRADWPEVTTFFQEHGFTHTRDVLNFVLDLVEMPTQRMRPNTTLTPLQPADVPDVLALAPGLIRSRTQAELEQHLCHNPAFGADSAFVIRDRKDHTLVAAGLLVENSAYTDPRAVDAMMPCFRTGAFGFEGLPSKRLNGLFSFVARDSADQMSLGLQMLEHSAYRLEQTNASTLAAQAPSDAVNAVRFYRQHFRRQGSFPIFEREL